MQTEGPFFGEVAEGVLGATEIVGVGQGETLLRMSFGSHCLHASMISLEKGIMLI